MRPCGGFDGSVAVGLDLSLQVGDIVLLKRELPEMVAVGPMVQWNGD
jgi:hypothetical protein